MTTLQTDPVGKAILGAVIEVHRALGPGLLEGVYQTCLAYELNERGLRAEREFALPVSYRGNRMDCGFRVDFLVEGDVIVECKSVDKLIPIHTAQVLTYLRLSSARQAFLFNFNALTIKEGMKSFLGSGHLASPGPDDSADPYPKNSP